MSRIRVAICDDDGLIRDGLGAILDSQEDMALAGAAADGEAIIELCSENAPDVVLMDIRMSGMDGVEATGRIKAANPSIKVIILTTFQDAEYVRGAMTLGAEGYILKSSPADVILEAVRAVHRGATILQTEVARTVGKMLSASEAAGPEEERMSSLGLAPREREILSLIAGGLSNKEIAAELHLSGGTVRNYISEMLVKTGARDRTQLAILYYRTRQTNRTGREPG